MSMRRVEALLKMLVQYIELEEGGKEGLGRAARTLRSGNSVQATRVSRLPSPSVGIFISNVAFLPSRGRALLGLMLKTSEPTLRKVYDEEVRYLSARNPEKADLHKSILTILVRAM